MRKLLAILAAAAALASAGCHLGAEEAEREASLGLQRARAGALEEARRHFERALSLDERNPKARYNLALSFLAVGDGKRAAEHLRRFLADRPRDAAGHFELGRALAVGGAVDEAVAELQRAMTLGFSDFRALEGGGFTSLEQDVRYLQVRALLAQRAGVVLQPDQYRPANGTGYGGVPVPVSLPGLPQGGACDRGAAPSAPGAGPAPAGAEACE